MQDPATFGAPLPNLEELPEFGTDTGYSELQAANSYEEWLLPTENAPPWEQFFDTDLLQRWAREVRISVESAADIEHWKLVGPCIAIEHPDAEEGADLLRCAAREAGFAFARVPAPCVMQISSGLREAFVGAAPILVMLDWGSWAVGNDQDSRAFASRLRGQLQEFSSKFPVLFAVCTGSVGNFTEDFRKVGAFDRVFSLQEPTSKFIGERFLNLLRSSEIDQSVTQAVHKVGLILKNEFETRDEQALAALALRRLSRQLGRPARLTDLTDLALRGTHEASVGHKRTAGEESRRRTAFHEAGHACIAVIASGGANIPDYASIVPARGFEGIVVESLAFADAQDDFTFDNLLLRTRIALAGRAGEELAFGPQRVSAGADSDLLKATRLTLNLFAHSGFHPGMERGESSAAHLAVLPRGEDIDPFRANRLHRDVRTFLANQYAYVVRVLNERRTFLDAVAERLLWDPVIDQEEMSELARLHGVPIYPPAAC
jgi:hypothetical protein